MTEEVKKDEPAAQPAKPAETAEAPKAPPTPPPKKEKPEKCEQCGKQLSRIKWYYRNNGYYCTKRCWREYRSKREEERKAAAAAEAKA
ncbi:MAG: hypothetical protein PHN82_02350 [bacterium]|nr:hypothetical protein [bacterium]